MSKLNLHKVAAAPSTPSTGIVAIYVKSDGKIYKKDDSGTEVEVGSSAGGDAISLQGRDLSDAAPSDGQAVVWDEANSMWKPADVASGSGDQYICQGRLTLESGVGVSSADQVDKTTLYFTPYNGNKIALYNQSTWDVHTFSEISISAASFSADTVNDIWIYNDGGTLTLGINAWASKTERSVALGYQDNVLIKPASNPSRRYLGTVYVDAAGKFQDTPSKRYVWNYYNRVNRGLYISSPSGNHTYNSVTQRYYNDDSTLKFTFVNGYLDQSFLLNLSGNMKTSNSSYVARMIFQLDFDDGGGSEINRVASVFTTNGDFGSGGFMLPMIGLHHVAVTEQMSNASGTGTYYSFFVSCSYFG